VNARKFLTLNLISSFFIESFIVFLIIFSPFIYASVTIFPLTVIEITSLFLLLLFSAKILFGANGVALVKIPFVSLVFFIVLILFQLIALPRGLLQYLSPGTLQLYVDFGFISMKNLTLSIYPNATLGMLLQFLSYLVVFFVTINYFDTEKKVKRIILVIIFSGFIYSFYGIIKRFAIEGVGFSTFTNRNHFSAYIQMIIPLAIGYSLTRKSVAVRSIFIFLASTMLLALFLALSRAGIVCVVVSLLILAIILRMKFALKKEAGVVILAVLFLAVLLGLSSGFDPTMQRLKTLLTPFQAMAGRLSLIKDTLNIIKDFPLWGVGLGALGEIFQKYKSMQGSETFSFTHNEPLQLIAETGVLGFLLIIIFLVEYFKGILHLLFKRRNPYVIYLSLGCLVGIISIFLHSLLDFVFHIPANTVLFVIILAMISRILYIQQNEAVLEQKQEINLPQYLKIISIFIFLSFFLLAASLIMKRYKAEQIFQNVKESGVGISKPDIIFKYRKKLRVLDKVIALNTLNSSYHNKKADIFSELAVRDDLRVELLNFKEFGDREKLLNLAEESYKKAIELNPTRADYHLRLGWFYGVTGLSELTKREFDKAILLDPKNYNIKVYIDNYFNKSVN
jgi:O-antigen ligase